jgi:hypothetical protein
VSALSGPHGRRSLGRRGLLLAAALAAVLVVGLVIVTHTGGHTTPQTGPRVVGAPAPGPFSDATHVPDAAAASAARTFLSGYLAFRYGQAGPDRIRDASPALIAVLSKGSLAVGPATRRLHPVILKLAAHEASGTVLHLTALISDGEGRYPLRIVEVRGPNGWETTQLANPE